LVLPSSSSRSSSKMGLLEYDNHYSGYDSYVSSGLPSPTSPHPSSLLPSPSSNIHFTFPSLPYPDHAIKEEPSPWTVPSLDLPSTSLTSNDHFPSSSPMLLSPAVSNLNTPRVSLSSTRSHGSHPDLSSRLRSSHSSLHSASASPLPYSDSHCPGTFGHSVSQYSNEQGNFMELSPPNPLTSLSSLSSRLAPGCVTPPRSGFSSPLQIAEPSMLPYHPAPPSYEQAVQHQYPPYMEPPPPPYAFSVLKSDPNLYCPPRPDLPKPEGFNCLPTLASEPHTPDPDSLLSDCGPDTPDSSIKEEPSEEASEGTGVLACKWRNCGREFTEKKYLVDHVTSSHIEQRKGCDDFPCFWEACPRRLKPFNAKYKLLTHMRVHTGEKPYICREGGCNRSFARLENLKIHNRSHTGEKPFLCKFAAHNNCNKAFSNSSDRAKHEQTHRDPVGKPYKCDVPGCQKRYTDPSSLRKHVKNHSREEQEQAMAMARQARESEACQQSEVLPSWAEAGTELRQGADPLSPSSLGLMAGGGLVGYSHYPAYTTPPQYRRAPEGQEFRRGEMHHQPNSLDSVEGDALPFDSVPIRFDGSTHEGYEWS